MSDKLFIKDFRRKVVVHVREYDYITNRTLQNLFDINVQRASAQLRALRTDGTLVKMTEHEGGPGVKYGPGPNFPK